MNEGTSEGTDIEESLLAYALSRHGFRFLCSAVRRGVHSEASASFACVGTTDGRRRKEQKRERERGETDVGVVNRENERMLENRPPTNA